MRFTTQAEYGLICALHLARNGGDGPVAAREMSEIEGLPADYTEKILRRLRQAGLVNSVRGVSGGFTLAKEPEAITVKDVIEATEGTTFEVNCETHQVDPNNRCGERHDCSIRPVWQALKGRIDELLDQIRLSDLIEQRESDMKDLIDVTWEADDTAAESTVTT